MATSTAMDALQLAGRIILENGGETYRAEDTLARMGRAFGYADVEVFGIPSGLFISLTDENGQRETSVARIRKAGTHLLRVNEVNRISRQVAEGCCTPAEALRQLRHAAAMEPYRPFWLPPLAAGISSAGFTWMYGGGFASAMVGLVCALLSQVIAQLLRRLWNSYVVSTLLSSAVCTFLPLLYCRWVGIGTPEAIVAGALMPLLPGLSMTNAVQDTLRGDIVSGVAHGVSAILTAALIAGGALAGHQLFSLLERGLM